eukprot:180114_1
MWNVFIQWPGAYAYEFFERFGSIIETNNPGENYNMQLRVETKKVYVNCKPKLPQFIKNVVYPMTTQDSMAYAQHEKLQRNNQQQKDMMSLMPFIAEYKKGGFKSLHELEKVIKINIKSLPSSVHKCLGYHLTKDMVFNSLTKYVLNNNIDCKLFKKKNGQDILQTTAFTQISAMLEGKHWSYDEPKLQAVIDWIKEVKILCDAQTQQPSDSNKAAIATFFSK